MTILKKPLPRKIRILVVTPEVTSLPAGMGTTAPYIHAKAGGLADVSASLIRSLFDQGVDIHVTLPDYRSIFCRDPGNHETITADCDDQNRIHLASDPVFSYLNQIYAGYDTKNQTQSLIFQREVINTILPRVRPDLIHCHDWMTGLIPAFARKHDIPCLFTMHNIHTARNTLGSIGKTGIDTSPFRKYLMLIPPERKKKKAPHDVSVDFLASGIFGAHYINTVSPTFFKEMIQGYHNTLNTAIRMGLTAKSRTGCSEAILNAPDPTYAPSKDACLSAPYNADRHVAGKKANKRFLQKKLGLIQDDQAPLFFWPSRLDDSQKGCRLLSEIFNDMLHYYRKQRMQIVFVADGTFRKNFMDIIHRYSLYNLAAVCDFDETLSRQAFAASDFILMPSRFEPCGLPQMIGPKYGSLPIVHDTGGLHDTVSPININQNTGNGFLFHKFNTRHFSQAIHRAMAFYNLPEETRASQIHRIMRQSAADFNHHVTANKYMNLYDRMLQQKAGRQPVYEDKKNERIRFSEDTMSNVPYR